MGKIQSGKTSNGGSERENFLQQSRDFEWGNPTAEGFDSRRLIEKGLVGKSALPSPSGKDHISRAYKHSPLSGESPISRKTNFEWEKSLQRSGSECRKSHHWSI